MGTVLIEVKYKVSCETGVPILQNELFVFLFLDVDWSIPVFVHVRRY